MVKNDDEIKLIVNSAIKIGYAQTQKKFKTSSKTISKYLQIYYNKTNFFQYDENHKIEHNQFWCGNKSIKININDIDIIQYCSICGMKLQKVSII